MTVGLRVRDRTTGQVIVEYTDRMTRIVGSFSTGTAAGSVTVDLSLGTGWAAVMEVPPTNPNIANYYRYPRVTVTGNIISWDFPGDSSWTILSCVVLYGVH
jgi:hypothetical protein